MRESVALFIAELTDMSPKLHAAFRGTVEYWAPDEPPVTIALSELGHSVVDDFDTMSLPLIDSLFRAIEGAMAGPDEDLSTAVATGMIEGMVSRAIRAGTWDRIRAQLGIMSARHADAWSSQ